MGIPRELRTVVSRDKVQDYLLSPQHPIGRTKALFFNAFGFRAEHPEVMEFALHEHGRYSELASEERTTIGRRFVAEGILRSPDGRNPLVRSVWYCSNGQDAHLVTAYPLRKTLKPRMRRS